MSTEALHRHVKALRDAIPYIHPAGRVTIDWWLGEMHDAADAGDTAKFAELAERIAERVRQEIEWYPEDTKTQIAIHTRGDRTGVV
jgi:hypothetical protein